LYTTARIGRSQGVDSGANFRYLFYTATVYIRQEGVSSGVYIYMRNVVVVDVKREWWV
jgi:hypothetical protein